MNTIHVKIPFWYKPFIRFMPDFYKDFPEEKSGSWTTRVDVVTSSFVNPVRYGKKRGRYESSQRAYLRARWRALWTAFWTPGSETGIQWVVVDKYRRPVRSYYKLPKIEDMLSYDQILNAQEYYQEHKYRIDGMLDETDIGFDVSEAEDKNDPRLWKPGHWLWFLHYNK